MGQKLSEDHLEMNLNDVSDGLIIEFDEKASFSPFSAEANESLVKSLGEIGRVLEHYPHMVVVEGFTDTSFSSSPRYASPEELSFARAEACAKVLLQTSGISAAVLQIAGHGANSPRADNVSPGGRRLNRRVQLRVLSLSKMRAGFIDATRKTEEG
jgi:chemotaxis protein MotB